MWTCRKGTLQTKTFMMMVALLGASPLVAQDASDTAAPPCPAGTAAACDAKGCETQACGEKSCPVDGCPTAVLTVETLTVAAANGDPIAQYMLAYLTETGVGMPQDSDKAAELYAAAIPNLVQAAEAGDPRACKALARAYAEGRGVHRSVGGWHAGVVECGVGIDLSGTFCRH